MNCNSENIILKTYTIPFTVKILRSPDGKPYVCDIEEYLFDLCSNLSIKEIEYIKVKFKYITSIVMGSTFWGFKGKIKFRTTKEKYSEFYFAFKRCNEDFYFVKYPSYRP